MTKIIGTLLALLGLIAFFLSAVSCVHLEGDGNRWSVTAVLTDLDDLDASGSGATVSKIRHSEIFEKAVTALEKAFAKYLAYQGLVFIGGEYFTQQGLKVSSAERLRLEELRNAKSIAEMQEATKRLQLMTPENPLP